MKKLVALSLLSLGLFSFFSCGSSKVESKPETTAQAPAAPSVNNHPSRMGGGDGAGVISKD